MLSPAQRKRLTDLENESLMVSFQRTKYTFDNSPRGVAEWDRLWARRIEIDKEIEKLKASDNVSMASQSVSTPT